MDRKNNEQTILVIRFSALGDVAMTIPVLYSVCNSNPDKRFVLLTRPLPSHLFINRPENLIVHPVDTKQIHGIGGLWKLWRRLHRQYRFSAVADLHSVLRSRILDLFAFVSGVKVKRIHKGRLGKRRLTRQHNKVMLPLTSSRARYREVFYRLNLPREDSFESLYPEGTAPHEIFEKATSPKQADETWIAIAPFAMHPGKIYPAEQMKEVVQVLASRTGYKLFMLGAGTEESAAIEQMADGKENMVNMAALKLGIEAELALMSYCDAGITMDSANMHMASLVALPVVSIWGATHPYCGFMGWRQHKGDAVQLQMPCRPCSIYGKRSCRRGDYHCLNGIPPHYIIERLDRVLRRRKYQCHE